MTATLEPVPRTARRFATIEFTLHPSEAAFEAPCRGTFVAPSGGEVGVQGFYDADDGSIARLRFCPEEVGRYAYQVACAGSSFEGELVVEASDLPGFVRVDPEHRYHFRYDAGGHPFLAGKTAWVLSASPLWREFLDLMVRQGQNVARFALGGLDFRAGWRRARWWRSRGDEVDLSRYNLAEWAQVDRAIRYGAERGILFEVCFYGDTTRTHGGAFPVPHPAMERFWDYAIARLAAYPNVLLRQLFNEHTGHPEYQEYMARYLRAHDPYGHLVAASGREVGDIPFPEARWNDVVVPHFCTGSHLDLHDFYRAWARRLRGFGKPLYVDETGRAGTRPRLRSPYSEGCTTSTDGRPDRRG